MADRDIAIPAGADAKPVPKQQDPRFWSRDGQERTAWLKEQEDFWRYILGDFGTPVEALGAALGLQQQPDKDELRNYLGL